MKKNLFLIAAIFFFVSHVAHAYDGKSEKFCLSIMQVSEKLMEGRQADARLSRVFEFIEEIVDNNETVQDKQGAKSLFRDIAVQAFEFEIENTPKNKEWIITEFGALKYGHCMSAFKKII